jgi:hypothetical protein
VQIDLARGGIYVGMEGSGWIMSIHEIEIPTCDGNGRQPRHCISGIFFEFIYNLVCPVLLPERHADASLKVASIRLAVNRCHRLS